MRLVASRPSITGSMISMMTRSGRSVEAAWTALAAVGSHARGPTLRSDALRDGGGQGRFILDHQNGTWNYVWIVLMN